MRDSSGRAIEAAIEKALAAFQDALNTTGPCERRAGRGYHHGFGEHGHDPDWCSVCGGSGFVGAHTEPEAMRAAVIAYLEARGMK